MNSIRSLKEFLFVAGLIAGASVGQGETITAIPVEKEFGPGNERPVLVAVSGLTGEAFQALGFDLYVQGFALTNTEAAQYLISGSNNGNLEARVTDRINKSTLLAKAYSGASLRRQVHRFSDDFIAALPGRAKGIAETRIAFKGESGHGSEVYMADFDGFNAQQVTSDGSVVAAPCCVPGRQAMYYTSYKLGGHPAIFYHNLATGARRTFAFYGGSNLSPAASPDGARVAMILSKDGWTDLYVGSADGGDPLRLTRNPQDESSPCWSPDGRWICYASKDGERRALSKIPAGGGHPQRLTTAGVSSPTEPDWSPDGQWIAFTSQYGGGFHICVIPAAGGEAIVLAEGEDPSWAPNSRTLVCGRRDRGRGNYVLSLLDVPTKQVKDIPRISGISSQSQPSWAK